MENNFIHRRESRSSTPTDRQKQNLGLEKTGEGRADEGCFLFNINYHYYDTRIDKKKLLTIDAMWSVDGH